LKSFDSVEQIVNEGIKNEWEIFIWNSGNLWRRNIFLASMRGNWLPDIVKSSGLKRFLLPPIQE
jgi:hypothetical protein